MMNSSLPPSGVVTGKVSGDEAAAPIAVAPPELSPATPINELFNGQSTALRVIAALGILFALKTASVICVPLLLGLMLSYSLNPLVNRLAQLRLPRALAAALLLISIVTGVASIAYSLSNEAAALIEAMPAAAQKLRRSIDSQSANGPTGAIETMQKAATELERATSNSASGSGSGSEPTPVDVTKVQIEKARFSVKEYLWPSALGLAAAVSQISVVLLLAFFLLASGDSFRRKMVKLAGPALSQKKLTLQAIKEINEQIQRYLLVQLFTSMLVGVATWLAFLWIGVDNAAVWGVASFALNFIPYVGSIVIIGSASLISYVQFGSVEMGLLVGGVSLFINSIEGGILTPWLTSKASRMNPVAVFVGILLWGWLLGIWGLFLGVPILLAIKAVCDRIETLTPVGELLGE